MGSPMLINGATRHPPPPPPAVRIPGGAWVLCPQVLGPLVLLHGFLREIPAHLVNEAVVRYTCLCLLVLLVSHPRWLSSLMMQSCRAHQQWPVLGQGVTLVSASPPGTICAGPS